MTCKFSSYTKNLTILNSQTLFFDNSFQVCSSFTQMVAVVLIIAQAQTH